MLPLSRATRTKEQTMQDQTNTSRRGGEFSSVDSSASTAAVDLSPSDDDTSEKHASSEATNQSMLYGRCVGTDRTEGIMSPDQDRNRENNQAGTPTPTSHDHLPDGGDQRRTSDSDRDSDSSSTESEQRSRVRTRVRDDGDVEEKKEETEAEAEAEENARTDHCPECGGRIVDDSQHGEAACTECGLIVKANEIDRGPEWRSFNQSEKESRSRVGGPSTLLQHDKGLSTNIGWQNKDAYGRTLSSEKQRKMSRLRKWNERARTKDSGERNLKKALTIVNLLQSKLNLPKSVSEKSAGIYRRCQDEDLIRGRSIEAMSGAAIHIACRQCEVPRTIDEVTDASRVKKKEILSAYRYISEELKLEVTPPHPSRYVQMVGSAVGASTAVREFAREMVDQLVETGAHSGKHPSGLAASAIYTADQQIAGGNLTQAKVAEVVDVTPVTIRNRKEDLIEVTDLDTADKYRERYESERDTQEEATTDDESDTGSSSVDDGSSDTDDSTSTGAKGTNSDESESKTVDSDDGDSASITVDFTSGKQSEIMVQVVRQIITEYDLLDAIENDEFVPPRCQKPLIAPKKKADELDGTWYSLEVGELFINTKLNTRDKKTRLKQLGDECGLEIHIKV